jgi:hypothetical protein
MENDSARDSSAATVTPKLRESGLLAACEDAILGVLAKRPDEPEVGATEHCTVGRS